MTLKKMSFVLALAGSLLVVACVGTADTPSSSANDLFIVTDTNTVVSVDKTNPTKFIKTINLSGFAGSNESVIGIDFRPFNRKMYAITKDATTVGRIYTVNPDTGVLTFIALLMPDTSGDPYNAAGTPTQQSPQYTGLNGNNFGVNFNPVADVLRIVSNTGQNLRVFLDNDQNNPQKTAGLTITDGTLSAGANTRTPFAATGAAYTNSFDGATTTRLFDIDTTNNALVLQNSANDGALITQAPLGLTLTPNANTGFDIDPETNIGYAVLTQNTTKSLYSIKIPSLQDTIPVASNAATKLANLTISGNVVGVAIRLHSNPIVTGLAFSGTTPFLVSFSSRAPSTLLSALNVTGLASNDELVSINYRPSNGKLYGLTRNGGIGKIYVITPTTASASLVSTLSNSNAIGGPITISAAKHYSINFDPSTDSLRVMSTAINAGTGGNGENYRVNVDTGITIVESDAIADATGGALRVSDVSGVTPASTNFNVQYAAYSNNYSTSSRPNPSTELFDIDSNNNQLLEEEAPNTGKLKKVGAGLGQTLINYGGFNITGGDNGLSLLAARTGTTGPYSLFNVDLSTGSATAVSNLTTGTTSLIGGAGGPTDLRSISIQYHAQ